MPPSITHLLGLILTALTLLHHLALWQRKEYRWDRIRAELMPRLRKPSGLWVFTAGIILLSINFRQAWVGLGVLALITLYSLYSRGLARPRLTPKIIIIACLTSVLLIGVDILLFQIRTSASLQGLLLVLSTPLITAIAVTVGNMLGNIQKHRLIQRARAYRQTLAHIKVIGITGSYGKTSTKFFVHHLMTDESSQIVMSAARRNEAYVIAQDMLANVKPETTTYIVEMAAYKAGEITRLAELVQPQIGVVTAIRNQHLTLFGSLANVAEAKWELVQSLPDTGVAVLNADDPTIQKQAAEYRGRVVWYSVQKSADVYGVDTQIADNSFTTTLHIQDQSQTITIPLAGEGYVQTAVAAAAVAHAAGVPASTIFKRLTSVSPVKQTMVVTTNSRGATIIDDSYSANEEGVLMALRHFERFNEPQKVVILRPLIELGPETERVHLAIGQALAKTQASVFLYDLPGAADIEQAAKEAGLLQPIQRLSAPKALAQAAQQAAVANTIVLLENRLPDIVRQAALA